MRQHARTTVASLAAGCLVMLWLLLAPNAALATPAPPHVVTGDRLSTDACAICHRVHDSTSDMPHRDQSSTEPTGSALLSSTETTRGDVPLCYSCHGTGQLGSDSDIETGFAQVSAHTITPTVSPYGPSPKTCSTCHDSHGSERTASGTPYPALLRSYEGTRAVYSGEAYCATCHTVRPGEVFDGLAVFRQTSHFTSMPVPASGSAIRCSICHAPHGSPVAPLLVTTLGPAAAPSTRTITADDRGFCLACHPAPSATWSGESTYAGSAHAESVATTAITAKWVQPGSRRIGECQVCHAAMGRSDGAGGVVSKLLEARGRVLCDRCHTAGGLASTDTSSEAYPSSEASASEIVAVYPSGDQAPSAGRVSVYGRALVGAQPRGLIGPRTYAPEAGPGPSASGDLDGDGFSELVVASRSESRLTIYSRDAFTGLSSQPASAALPGGAHVAALKVANVVQTGLGWVDDRPEIVVVTTGGDLVFYHYTAAGSELSTVAGPVSLGAGPWGLATGDATGTARAEAVVTARADARLTIATDDGAWGVSTTTETVGLAPVAPVVGDIWADLPEGRRAIVVADADPATSTVHVLDGDARRLADYDVARGGGVPVASAVGDVLWDLPTAGGDDLALAMVDEGSGDSTVVVVPQVADGSGLATDTAVARTLGAGRDTGTLLAADVEGDGRVELVAGDAGTWSTGSDAVAPSIDVVGADGTGQALAAPTRYPGGGTEMAGAAPSLVVADFGAVVPSRHPIDEVNAGSHVSTEAVSATRHVTCADCHDSHEATDTASTAPAVQGALRGAWGVTVSAWEAAGPVLGPPARSTTSWGVCFKCHGAGRDAAMASDFDPSNVSGHAVIAENASPPDIDPTTFVAATGFSGSSVLYCSDCHGMDGRTGAQARAPHTSLSAPILAKPYAGVAPDDQDLLCYTCHRRAVYATDSVGISSGFLADSGASGEMPSQHVAHVASPSAGGHGIACSACHVSHGTATEPHMLRSDIGFLEDGAHSGSCESDCHTTPVPRTYGH